MPRDRVLGVSEAYFPQASALFLSGGDTVCRGYRIYWHELFAPILLNFGGKLERERIEAADL
jgi:hypothetical protein